MSRVRRKVHHRKLPTANWKLHASCAATLVCCGLMALAGRVQAQTAPVSQGPGSKYYVWGQVRSPGAYSFIASPDILELLSAGGGPTDNANLKRVILIRAVTKKRMRINLQAMLDKGQVVRLSPGDVVIVPSSPWYHIRDWLTVVTSAATLVTLVLTIMNRVSP
jgi:hypothetical protein